MQRIEVNCETGVQTIIDLTPEEIVAAQEQAAQWEAEQTPVTPMPTIEELLARIAALENK
jgi:hypothetical protein